MPHRDHSRTLAESPKPRAEHVQGLLQGADRSAPLRIGVTVDWVVRDA